MVAPEADRHATRMKWNVDPTAKHCLRCPPAAALTPGHSPLHHYTAKLLTPTPEPTPLQHYTARLLALPPENTPLQHYTAKLLMDPPGADNRTRDPLPEKAQTGGRPVNSPPRNRTAAGASAADRPATQR